MPKIIENLQYDILRESMDIIDTEGIDALSIRHLSAKLGIAPSTIYNYYDSKEQIIGALTKHRWDEALKRIDSRCCDNISACEALSMIVEELRSSVKPLLIFHISSAGDMHKQTKSTCKHTVGHTDNHQKDIFIQLQTRVKAILETRNHSYEDPQFSSSVITKLLITCMHDDELKFEVLAATIKKL